MLPSDLLRIRRRKQFVIPKFIGLNDSYANWVLSVFKSGIGKKKWEIRLEIKELAYTQDLSKLVDGLTKLMERKCEFVVDSPVDPYALRKIVFELSSKSDVITREDRNKIIKKVGERMNHLNVDRYLYADMEGEHVLTGVNEVDLVGEYNLSLLQTLLFRCIELKIRMSDGYKEVFRAIKYCGLMYDYSNGTITITGPLSLLKMTEKYGNGMARVLPSVIPSKNWELEGKIVLHNQMFNLKLSSNDGVHFPPNCYDRKEFDSGVEETFARRFRSLVDGWEIVREPEPLLAGKRVMIPDFAFVRKNIRVLIEIVGFWTKEYLEKKMRKLSLLNEPMVILVNKNLACGTLENVVNKNRNLKLLYYGKDFPVMEIIKMLKEKEQQIHEVEKRKIEKLNFEDLVFMERKSEELNVGKKVLRDDLAGKGFVPLDTIAIKKENYEEKIKTRISRGEDLETALVKVREVLKVGNERDAMALLREFGYEIKWINLNRAIVFP